MPGSLPRSSRNSWARTTPRPTSPCLSRSGRLVLSPTSSPRHPHIPRRSGHVSQAQAAARRRVNMPLTPCSSSQFHSRTSNAATSTTRDRSACTATPTVDCDEPSLPSRFPPTRVSTSSRFLSPPVRLFLQFITRRLSRLYPFATRCRHFLPLPLHSDSPLSLLLCKTPVVLSHLAVAFVSLFSPHLCPTPCSPLSSLFWCYKLLYGRPMFPIQTHRLKRARLSPVP